MKYFTAIALAAGISAAAGFYYFDWGSGGASTAAQLPQEPVRVPRVMPVPELDFSEQSKLNRLPEDKKQEYIELVGARKAYAQATALSKANSEEMSEKEQHLYQQDRKADEAVETLKSKIGQ